MRFSCIVVVKNSMIFLKSALKDVLFTFRYDFKILDVTFFTFNSSGKLG